MSVHTGNAATNSSKASDAPATVSPRCPHCGYDTRACHTPAYPKCGSDCTLDDWKRIGLRKGRIVVVMWLIAAVVSVGTLLLLQATDGGRTQSVWQLVASLVSIAGAVSLYCKQLRVGHLSTWARRILIIASIVGWLPLGWYAVLVTSPVSVPILVIAIVLGMKPSGYRSSPIERRR